MTDTPNPNRHLYEFPCPHCKEAHSFKDLQSQQLRMIDPDKPVKFVQCKGCKKQFEVADDHWGGMYRVDLRSQVKTVSFL